MAGLVPAIHDLLKFTDGSLGLFYDQSTQRHLVRRRHQQLAAARLRTSGRTDKRIYTVAQLEEIGLCGAFRRHPVCHSARNNHQALAPRLESPSYPFHESGME